jgi:hypothetical protein
MLNKSYDAFIWRYLNIMYSVSPSKYAQNLINYNEFHNILPYEKQSNFETNTKLNSKILNKTSDGFQSTKIKARRNTIEKFFTPKQ